MSPEEWLRGLKTFILVEELREFKIILNMKSNYFLVEEIYSYQVSEVMVWGHDWNLYGGELGSTK